MERDIIQGRFSVSRIGVWHNNWSVGSWDRVDWYGRGSWIPDLEISGGRVGIQDRIHEIPCGGGFLKLFLIGGSNCAIGEEKGRHRIKADGLKCVYFGAGVWRSGDTGVVGRMVCAETQ